MLILLMCFNHSYLIEGLKLCPKFVRSGSLSKHIPCADLRSDSKLDYHALSLNDSTQTTPDDKRVIECHASHLPRLKVPEFVIVLTSRNQVELFLSFVFI